MTPSPPQQKKFLSLILLIARLSPLILLSQSAESFSLTPTVLTTLAGSTRRCNRDQAASDLRSSMSTAASDADLSLLMEDEDDNEMEWVEEEFELLTESDFYNTEWKLGTLMEGKPRSAESIDTTWVRLVTNDMGENLAIWGDDAKGKWTVDVPSQFFSISKESFGGWFGKQIWAGTIEDFYYLEGTVRGWGPISPASVVGQWQAVRLGVVDGDRVSVEERGEAPWFEMKEDEGDEGDEEGEENEGELQL
mmetsp:Transcript_17924/g.43107  ORF Transcript_17924/g.43107 Transcript_17924/m.43107 type:complete len:250 (+) Transcript_17924:67-816(+)